MIIFHCLINGCEQRLLEHQCKEHLITKHMIRKFKANWCSIYFRWEHIKV